MRHRPLGRSGTLVSEIGLGANNFGGRLDERASIAVIHAALDHGINLIDTADIYNAGRSEEIVGRAIAGRRDRAIVATKVGLPSEEGDHAGGLSARHIARITERSLRRLAVDHIDLLQLHIPDAATPREETWRALDDLISAGKVRHVGSTNFYAWEVADWVAVARERGEPVLVSASSEWSLLHREPERELAAAAAALGVGILPFRPLAQGFLTGKYLPDRAPPPGTRFDLVAAQRDDRLSPANFAVLAAVVELAQRWGIEVGALALGYLLSHRVVSSVLVGASSAEQIADSVRWAELELDAVAVDELVSLLPPLGGHHLGRPELRGE